jgi:hypothetical protein
VASRQPGHPDLLGAFVEPRSTVDVVAHTRDVAEQGQRARDLVVVRTERALLQLERVSGRRLRLVGLAERAVGVGDVGVAKPEP